MTISQPALLDLSALPPLCQRCEKQPAAHVIEFIPHLKKNGDYQGDTLALVWNWSISIPMKSNMTAVCEGCKEEIINATI